MGAGAVSDVETASRCLDAGAAFLTSPGLGFEIVEFALKKKIVGVKAPGNAASRGTP